MHNNQHKQIWFVCLLSLVLTALIIIMIMGINNIQGNARIVNYAGVVRGATQRLVKNELRGIKNDEEIARMDRILLGLQTGKGSLDLEVMRDPIYQQKLHFLAEEWDLLKQTIYEVRKDATKSDELYELSEVFFIVADKTVTAAELYTEKLAHDLKIIERLTILNIVLLLSFLLMKIVFEIKKNHRLNYIAFVDPNTGLPNKRSCEEKLNETKFLNAEQNICCFMFDLNNLKMVNDTMGHKCGDALITSFASLLRRSAPANMFIGRFGGDEFIGILEGTNKEQIDNFTNQLKCETTIINGIESKNQIHIDFAYGYAFSVDYPNCSQKALMDIADKKMYENKLEIKKRLISK